MKHMKKLWCRIVGHQWVKSDLPRLMILNAWPPYFCDGLPMHATRYDCDRCRAITGTTP